MVSLFVLFTATLLGRATGFVGAGSDTWLEATLLGLAAMFTFTGLSHFSGLRADFIRMVPPIFPVPGALVSLTGVLELLGAAGLLVPALRPYAAFGLALLLVVMLPANLYAAQRHIPLGGKPPTPLGVRVPVQALYLGLAVWAAVA